MVTKKIIFSSLCTVGVASGTGGGIYYAVTKQEDKFSGSLIFEQKDKDDKKIYKAKLSTNQEGFSGDEVCKLDKKKLSCKFSDLNKQEIEKYLDELNKKLEEIVLEDSEDNSELLKKLKEKLTENSKFESIFGKELFANMKTQLQETP